MEHKSPTASVSPIDRLLHAAQGKVTAAISPTSMLLAYLDWAIHLANSPGKQAELIHKALKKSGRYALFARNQFNPGSEIRDDNCCIEPLPQDNRFRSEKWQTLPFSLYAQAFLNTQQWLFNATTEVHGVSRHHEEVVWFTARQLLDTLSPSNFVWTNPDLLEKTVKEGGMNLYRGAQNFLEDWQRNLQGSGPVGTENFRVGKNLASTPGKVVYKNRLMELIQYSPTTDKSYARPVLFVPAWIMKYYILDLSDKNSMVRYLLDKGHTVFMISWKNPTEQDRNLGMESYVDLGVLAALNKINEIMPKQPVNCVGYCLGGTLLSIAAALLAKEESEQISSITLLAAQTDFKEAGELMLFIDHSQIAYLEDIMWEQGYLDTKQMAGAFQLLRSNDLVWSKIVHDYLMGQRQPINDLMAWNSDATRMPYKMHSEYLEKLFLNNDFAERRYRIHDKSIALDDIRCPFFVVGTEKDHVAPWRSVYKIRNLVKSEVTFLLTSSGHNTGIISEPGHPRRHYRVSANHRGDKFLSTRRWLEATPIQEGSWWPEWANWLKNQSGEKGTPPLMEDKASANSLSEAPGRYVLEP